MSELSISQLLGLVDTFKKSCPKALLRREEMNLLDGTTDSISSGLNLLAKVKIDENQYAQYQVFILITEKIEQLKIRFTNHKKELKQLKDLQTSIEEFKKLHCPNLTAAETLMAAVKDLQQFDSSSHGAIYNLLRTMKAAFERTDLSAHQKLEDMIQQVIDTQYAIRTSTFGTPLRFLGVSISTSHTALGDRVETFIQTDMAAIAKSNNIVVPSSPSKSF